MSKPKMRPDSVAPVRIAHLTSVHKADDVRIFLKEGRSAAAAGYDVALVAPGAPPGTVCGVKRFPLPIPKTRGRRLMVTQIHLLKAALTLDADVYHFHDPELIGLGLLLHSLGKRVIYDVHEDLPRLVTTKSWIRPSLRGPIAAVMEAVEGIAAKKFSAIVAATPTIAARFPSERTVTVQNWPRAEELCAASSVVPYQRRENICVYIGGITKQRGAQEMVAAAERVGSRWPVRIVFAGNFRPPGLVEDCEAMPGWQNCQWVGWLQRDGVRDLLGRARIGLVTLHATPNHLAAQPVKLFEYMAAGLPVVASDFPLWREIVGGVGCALFVDPENPSAIAEAIGYLLENPEAAEEMGRKGQIAVAERFNWGAEEAKLLGMYNRVLHGGMG